MNRYYVYQHVNPINNYPFYIGVGSFYNKKNGKIGKYYRAFSMAEAARNNTYWQKIFKDCGNSCKVEVLFEYDDIQDAYAKEIELIKQYGKICNGTGILANIQDGGVGGGSPNGVLCYDLDGNFLYHFWSIEEAAILLGAKYHTVYSSIKNGFSLKKKYVLKFFEPSYPKKIDPYIVCQPIFQYDKNGIFIKKWRSVEEASSATGIDRGSIRRNLYGKYKQAGGFIWSKTIL